MKKKHFVILSIIAVVGLLLYTGSTCGCGKSHTPGDGSHSSDAVTAPADATEMAKADASKAPAGTSYIVYYFHGKVRCPSCQKIEKYTYETVNSKYSDDLKKGRLIWRQINVDEKANSHFIKDYNLFTKSVIIVEMKDGKQIRWKNLDKVWELLGDQSKFSSYIETEINSFREKS